MGNLYRIINNKNLDLVRKEIKREKEFQKKIIVQAQNEKFNRKILENKGVDVLLSPEFNNLNDKLKQRNSGLNEILCKIAKKNDISIGIELKKIINLQKKDKTKILSRIIQNISLCKRIGTKILIIDKEKFSKQEIFSFFLSLGCSTKKTKEIFLNTP